MGRENADVTREEVTMAWQHQLYSGKQRKEDLGSGMPILHKQFVSITDYTVE